MSTLQMIVDRVRETFKRNKVPIETKVLAAMLCKLSYKKASKLVGKLPYVAVHDAFMVLKYASPKLEKKYRRCIAIDGTKTKLGKKGSSYDELE